MFIRIFTNGFFLYNSTVWFKNPVSVENPFPVKSKPGTEIRHFYLTSVFLTIDCWISLNNLLYKNSIIAFISFLIKSIQYFKSLFWRAIATSNYKN